MELIVKKIFIGGPGCCGGHFEKSRIKDFMSVCDTDYEITTKYEEANIIVIIDTCMATYSNIEENIKYLEKVLNTKKHDSKVIVSGCLSKGVKFELSDKYQNILNKTTIVKPDKIMEYVCRIISPNFETELQEIDWLEDFSFPYQLQKNSLSISLNSGCINHCSFCKTNYMNFPLKSITYEKIESMTNDIAESNYVNHIRFHSSNLSLYGNDLYGKQKLHEAVHLLTSPDCIKFVNLGALINFYPELIKEIIENSKIKIIFVSLESGSERIYNLMNRPISLKKLVEIIKLIKQYRSDIIIQTELMCGFPTETIDDLKKSIELVQELDISPIFAHAYINSKQIPSSQLPQHSYKYNIESRNYLVEKLQPLHQKYLTLIKNNQMIVVKKSNNKKIYLMLCVDGSFKRVNFDQIDKEYNVNEIIPANTIISKQIVKRRILQK